MRSLFTLAVFFRGGSENEVKAKDLNMYLRIYTGHTDNNEPGWKGR
ncbi:MAG: hypothetical protein IKC65_04985 [Lentisphaeria bacterium]|nr:hypothetical protein [Lentisphaeria bacterium]